jgi:hypothetical protein
MASIWNMLITTAEAVAADDLRIIEGLAWDQDWTADHRGRTCVELWSWLSAPQ